MNCLPPSKPSSFPSSSSSSSSSSSFSSVSSLQEEFVLSQMPSTGRPGSSSSPAVDGADVVPMEYSRCVRTVTAKDSETRSDHVHHACSIVSAGEHVFSTSSGGTNVLRHLDLLPCGEILASTNTADVKSLAVADDGTLVVTAHDDHKIRLWKLASNAPSLSSSSAFSSSHKHVATLPSVKERLLSSLFQSNYVQVRRHHKKLWMQHADTISVLAVTKTVLYSGSWDKTVKVWRLSDLRCVESIAAHNDAVNALAVNGTYLYTGSGDGKVKVWERRKCSDKNQSTHKHSLVGTLEGHSKQASVNALAISADGKWLYSGGSDAEVAAWKRSDECNIQLACKLKGHQRPVLCLCITPGRDGLLLSGSADETIRVWRRMADAMCCVAVLRGHRAPVRSLCADARPEQVGGGCVVYSRGGDQSLKVWWLSRELQQHSLPRRT